MEFTCQTVYDQQTLTVTARALRKTARKASSRHARLFAWGIIALCLVFLCVSLDTLCVSLDTPCIWMGFALAIVLLLLLIWKEDAFSAFFAGKYSFSGPEPVYTAFHADCYESQIAGVSIRWPYSNVLFLVEDAHFFIFILEQEYAQAYDKAYLAGGSKAAFRRFLEERTGSAIQTLDS